ncbi:uncharacterized protein LOC120331909 [Styela clava]
MANKVNYAGIAGFVVALCGTVLLALSMSTIYWRSPKFESDRISDETEVNTGLFVTCTVESCTNIGWLTNAGATLTTTRVLLLVACVLIIISLIIGVIALCGHADIVTKGAMDIVIGIIILSACSAYTGLTITLDRYQDGKPSARDFNWGFYLCWISCAVFIIAGVFEVKGEQEIGKKSKIHPASIQQQLKWTRTNQPSNISGSSASAEQTRSIQDDQIISAA